MRNTPHRCWLCGHMVQSFKTGYTFNRLYHLPCIRLISSVKKGRMMWKDPELEPQVRIKLLAIQR